MEFEELSVLIFNEVRPKLENHLGLSLFAKERAKFEGWLKVELCDSLLKHFNDVVPEHERVDVSFDDWGIELKTLNTNIRYEGIKNKIRPITKNTQGVIDDIEKLQEMNFKNKGVLFIVFPITGDNKNWLVQLQRIKSKLKDIKNCPFNFKNSKSGIIYFGLI